MTRNLVVLFLLVPMTAFAQGAASVAGRVLDMTTDMPVGFATIVVENAASPSSRSGALAGEDGRFVLQGLAPGQYRIRVTFPGFLEAEDRRPREPSQQHLRPG